MSEQALPVGSYFPEGGTSHQVLLAYAQCGITMVFDSVDADGHAVVRRASGEAGETVVNNPKRLPALKLAPTDAVLRVYKECGAVGYRTDGLGAHPVMPDDQADEWVPFQTES